jgi:hypothetical protein
MPRQCSNLSAKNTIDPINNSILRYSLRHDVRQLAQISTLCIPQILLTCPRRVSPLLILGTIFTFHCLQLPDVIEDIFHMERNEVNLVLRSLRSLVRIPGIECRRSQREAPEGEDDKGLRIVSCLVPRFPRR